MMNSEQFCQTKEWQDFKNNLWKELYSIENSYHYKLWDGTWIDGEPTFLHYPELPHPKEGGVVIKCAYCGWYGKNTEDRYHCFDHILPVHSHWNLRLSYSNIVIACNHCNKQKGGHLLDKNILSNIMIQFQKDVLGGVANLPPSKLKQKKVVYTKKLIKVNNIYKVIMEHKKKYVIPNWMR